MRVIAGSVILEPGLNKEDFAESPQGRHAGEGRVRRGRDALRLRADGAPTRKAAGMITTVPHRRLVDPGLGRDHGRPSAHDAARTCRSTSTAARPRCRMRISARHPRKHDRASGLHRGQSAHHAAVRRLADAARRVRPSHHRDRYADRKRHHAARHALHHRASGQPRRMSRRALHLRRDRQQRASLRSRQRIICSPGHDADIVLVDAPRGRHAGRCARRDQARRHRRRSAR